MTLRPQGQARGLGWRWGFTGGDGGESGAKKGSSLAKNGIGWQGEDTTNKVGWEAERVGPGFRGIPGSVRV